MAKKILAVGIDSFLNGAKNGIKNGAKNGAKNGINGKVNHVIVDSSFGKRVPEVTGADLAKQKAVDTHLTKVFGRGNYGPRKPGSPVKSRKATSRMGARSVIASEPVKMLKAYPELKQEINAWMRNAYTYARTNGSLEGYKNFEGPDGRLWRPKPSQSAFEPMVLKGDDKQARSAILRRRSNRERPWTKRHGQDQIYAALLKIGKEHHYDKLIQIMKRDFTRKMNSLGGQTKGHFISLDNGGLDVAENFGPQRGRSLRIRRGDRFEVDPGNYSEQADSTVGFGSGKGVDNWDDYVRMKLPELE